MSTATRNECAKALVSFMANAKDRDDQIKLEWEMSANTKGATEKEPNRPKPWSQKDFCSHYSRDDWRKGRQGATKTCHVECHNGNEFKCIVVKRHQTNGYIDEHANNPDYFHTGNQLIDEIRCWERFAKLPESDFLCPILKYFTCKSDKVAAISEKMQERIVIVAQKAVYVSNAEMCCIKAAELNGETEYYTRYNDMKNFAHEMHWRDALRNPGNAGVIFDYNEKRYKAVFIDYAL